MLSLSIWENLKVLKNSKVNSIGEWKIKKIINGLISGIVNLKVQSFREWKKLLVG